MERHGMRHTQIYGVWAGIKDRTNPQHKNHKNNYRKLNISMCEEWRNSFLSFYNWAISNGYKEEKLPNGKNKYTIDRIDCYGDYCPENCRWIPIHENSSNKSTTRHIEVDGVTKNGNEWSIFLGFPETYINRVCRIQGEDVAKELIRRRIENPTLKTRCGVGWLQTYGLAEPKPKPNSGIKTRIAVRQLKDGIVIGEYKSIGEACRIAKVGDDTIKRHIEDCKPDIHGYTWERIQKQEKA